MAPLIHYTYLQILDLLTTLAFLVNGQTEGNPVVRFAMHAAPTPLAGLAAVKFAALAIGIYCWRSGRTRALVLLNVLFAIAVAWNMVAVILGSVHPA